LRHIGNVLRDRLEYVSPIKLTYLTIVESGVKHQ
jgi:hypothetical protein